VLVTPVIIMDEVIGVMFFNYQNSQCEFNQAQVDFVSRFAASLTLALDNSRIYKELQEEITARLQAEEALKKSNDDLTHERNRLLAVMEALPIGISILDQSGGVVQTNQGFEVVWGGAFPPTRSVEDFEGYPAWWVDTGQRLQPEEWAAAQALRTGETVTGQFVQIQRFDGTRAFVLNSAAPIRNADGDITGSAVAIMDITDQKRLEREQQEQAIQIEVQHRLMNQREQDRHALARDLHDGPIQMLSSTLFHLHMVKEAFPDPALQAELDQTGTDIKNTIQELRDVMNNLRPPALMHFGFARVLQMYAEDFRTRFPDVEIQVDAADDDRILSNEAHLTLYRIYQAAINNIIRHAGASKIWVVYKIEPDSFSLELRDNGQGFAHTQDFSALTRTGHFGLVGMKERAEAIGGNFSVSSETGKGTTILIRAPLSGRNLR
jgi:PAS domain S-box-containing protein